MKNAFGFYSDFTADSRFGKSEWLLENNGCCRVRAHDYESAAVPAVERDLGVLTSIISW